MSDQHRADMMGCAGDVGVLTPSLDRLAADGVRFSRVSCQGPLCMPARASFMTERYVRDHGVYTNWAEIAPDSPTYVWALREAGYHTTLLDDRAEFLKRERFPEAQIELLVADDWSSAVRAAVGNGRGVSVAVVTRGHNEDEQCMHVAVHANPDYVGLIGSKRRTSIVIDRLREAGMPDEQLSKIHAPIGLDIGAVSPEEVALAILAEIITERRGGTGAPLSSRRRKS